MLITPLSSVWPADDILGGKASLCLTTDWLAFLNYRFPRCDPELPFTPAAYSGSQPDHEHLGFLFEFFQKVPNLKVSHPSASLG